MLELFEETNKDTSLVDQKKNATLIDFKKIYLTEIIFNKFKWSVQEISDNIRKCNLEDDHIAALMTVFPLSDGEMLNLKSYTQNDKKLSVPEKFFLEMLNVTNIRERLECCAFKNNIDILLSDIRQHYTIVQRACASVSSSKKFASVLRIVYKLGSILNKDSYLDNAAGFKLDALPKLKDTKTKDGQNLLNYLTKTLAKQKPALLKFPDEIKHVNMAVNIQIPSVKKLWDFIEHNLNVLKAEVERTSKSNDKFDILFFETFGPILPKIEQQIDSERKSMNTAFDTFKQTVEFFGEDPNTCTTEEFFGYISTFIKDFTLSIDAMKSRKNRKKNGWSANGTNSGNGGNSGSKQMTVVTKII